MQYLQAHRLTEVVSRFRMAGEAGQPSRRGSALVTPKPRLTKRPLARQLEHPVDSEWKEF